MGATAAETVREIESTRARLDGEIRELEGHLPQPAVWAKRLVGLAVGGGIGGTLFWLAAHRLRTKKKVQEAKAQEARAIIQLVPDRWAERMAEDGRWKLWGAAVGGAWLLLRLAEVRQMRRTNRLLLGRAGPA